MPLTLRIEIFCGDLDATVRFYGRALAFDLVDDRRRTAQPYVALRRDDVRIGAVASVAVPPDRRLPPAGTEIVLEVDDLAAEVARISGSGAVLLEEVLRRPWGLRDVRLVDPDGYYLRVTDRLVTPVTQSDDAARRHGSVVRDTPRAPQGGPRP